MLYTVRALTHLADHLSHPQCARRRPGRRCRGACWIPEVGSWRSCRASSIHAPCQLWNYPTPTLSKGTWEDEAAEASCIGTESNVSWRLDFVLLPWILFEGITAWLGIQAVRGRQVLLSFHLHSPLFLHFKHQILPSSGWSISLRKERFQIRSWPPVL